MISKYFTLFSGDSNDKSKPPENVFGFDDIFNGKYYFSSYSVRWLSGTSTKFAQSSTCAVKRKRPMVKTGFAIAAFKQWKAKP